MTIVAVAVAATTPLIAYVGNLGLAPLAALAGLACLVDIGAPRRWPAGVWALIALLVWALASYAWSPLRPTLPALMRKPDAVTGLKLALELLLYGAFVAGMARVGPRGGAGALASLTVTLAVVLLLLAVEAGSGMAVFRAMRDLIGAPLREDFLIHRVARCCYVACVLMWPLGAWLLITGRRLVACALWLAVLGTSIVLRVDSPVIALVLASAAAASIWTFGPLRRPGARRIDRALPDVCPGVRDRRRSPRGTGQGVPGRRGSTSGASPSARWRTSPCSVGDWTPAASGRTASRCIRMTPPSRSGSNWASWASPLPQFQRLVL